MSDFKDRLKIELDELSDKIDKLDNFINSENFDHISEVQKSLLTVQYSAMETYWTCLIVRFTNLD